MYDGVNHAAKMFPNAYAIMILIGALKGNGESFVKVGERLIRGVWTPEAVEFVEELPHTATGKLQKVKLREMFKDYSFPQ